MSTAFISVRPVGVNNSHLFKTSNFLNSRRPLLLNHPVIFTHLRHRRTRNPTPNHTKLTTVIHASTTTPAASPSSSISPAPVTTRLVLTRLFVFLGMSMTYAAYVFLRSTFTYVAPSMIKTLSLSLPQIGQITSAFPLAYGASRLVTGVVVDRARPHHALCTGLLLAGLVNIAMGASSSVPLLAALWALNGLVQGVGAGASAKMLTAWFPPRQRGLYWALWSTSANVGAFLAPVVCARLAANLGFRSGLVGPGIAAVMFALVMLPILRSSPADAGLIAPWESANPEADDKKDAKSQTESCDETTEDGKSSWRQILIKGVLQNKTIWSLAAAYFFVYLVRNGTKSWLHFWLVESIGMSVSDAANRVSCMEIGGILGTFSAGIVSDMTGGRRVIVTLIYLSLVIAALCVTWYIIPAGAPAAAAFAAFAAIGFAINGPQMMIGLIGAEACDRRVVATATGVLGWISYMGAAAAGFPLSVVIRKGGWAAYFIMLLVGCVGAILCLMPMWRMKAASHDAT